MIKKVVLLSLLAAIVSLIVLTVFGYYLRTNEKDSAANYPPNLTKAQILEKSSSFYQTLFAKLKEFPSVQIGKPYVISSDWPLNGDGVCFTITVNGAVVGDFSDLNLWDKTILGYRCNPNKDEKSYPESDFFGDSEIEYSSIDLTSGTAEKLTPINWSFLSNPKVCGSYIAYWGTSDKTEVNATNLKVFAYVYNWVSKEVRIEKQISSKQIATDDSGYFQTPEWSSDCKSATFTDEGVANTVTF
tara:strand:- start:37354 stop:38085 length:732 start_codon:yes stop_codon:yes gene_type:complete